MKLVALHRGLYDLAKNKTEALKKNDIDSLQQIVKEERKFVKTIEKFNEQLKTISLQNNPPTKNVTFVQLIELFGEDERRALVDLTEKLIHIMNKIKIQNDLNQELLKQSLDFIHYSIEMLLPQLDEYNYEQPNAPQYNESKTRSMFDSKA